MACINGHCGDLPTIKYYCHETVPQLIKQNDSDAGYDLRCLDQFIKISPGESVSVSTGLHIAIPEGFVGLVKSRSGLAFKHCIEAGAGVIDPPYRGEVKVLLHNHGQHTVQFTQGDRIAQLIIVRLSDMPVERIDDLSELGETDRGSNGFGSSGL